MISLDFVPPDDALKEIATGNSSEQPFAAASWKWDMITQLWAIRLTNPRHWEKKKIKFQLLFFFRVL